MSTPVKFRSKQLFPTPAVSSNQALIFCTVLWAPHVSDQQLLRLAATRKMTYASSALEEMEEQQRSNKNTVFIGVRKRLWGKFMVRIRDPTHKGRV
jgi:hypothetical protein